MASRESGAAAAFLPREALTRKPRGSIHRPSQGGLATKPGTKTRLTGPRQPWRGVTWLIGGVAALIAATVALVLALGFFLFAVFTALILTIRAAFGGARVLRTRRHADLIEARSVGGHSWVAYGWDGRR